MPMGMVWLVAGIVIGLIAGWLLFDALVAGGAAGFVITLTVLLVGNWRGSRDSDENDISISG